MKAYSLIDDFIDTAEERALMAAIAGAPALYWELLDTLPTEAFAAEPEAWGALAAAIEAERQAVRTRANISMLGLQYIRDAEERERRVAVHEEAKARVAVLAGEIRDHAAQVRALESEIRRAEAALTNAARRAPPNR